MKNTQITQEQIKDIASRLVDETMDKLADIFNLEGFSTDDMDEDAKNWDKILNEVSKMLAGENESDKKGEL